MKIANLKSAFIAAAGALALGGCGIDAGGGAGEAKQAIVAGAGYTTFDATIGGCKDSPNGVDCNNYASKDAVFLSGGPAGGHGALSDGQYFFAILTPGSQNGGFLEGAQGNLSDVVAGGTAGDNGTGDDISNRTFSVAGGLVTYGGTHAMGVSPNGHAIIQAMPYDDTDNNGGVYILAICQVGATSSSQCKYDAFRIQTDDPVVTPVFAVVAGGVYYDANANGAWDTGEVGIASWVVHFTDHVADDVVMDANGAFKLSMMADTYTWTAKQGGGTWMQTGNLVDQTSVTGGATATLNADKTYTTTVIDNSTVSGLNFGELCIGAGGGLTLGYWSNKNGQAEIGADDLAMLAALNLRTANGSNFDPASYKAFRTWILNATATNMAYMLSAQLATMELNVLNNHVAAGALVYAPGAISANANGFATVGDLMNEANTSLGAYGYTVASGAIRDSQQALETALDKANNNHTFAQGSAAQCPAPVFQ